MPRLSAELSWLAAASLLTALLWVPYVANRFRELGPPGWQWFPAPDPAPVAPWAARAMRAHANAVENLVVFAPLALTVHAAALSTPATQWASQAYFWARLSHYVVCVVGAPIVPRTIAFLVGVAAQLTLAVSVLQALA